MLHRKFSHSSDDSLCFARLRIQIVCQQKFPQIQFRSKPLTLILQFTMNPMIANMYAELTYTP